MPSRANSLRAYAEQLLESDNTTLAAEEVSGLVDDLIEFAEQWEAELESIRRELTPTETDAAGILIRPQVKVE